MKRLHGYCAVLALTYVSGLPESQVVDMCRWHGFKDNGEGAEDEVWIAAAKDLGIRMRRCRASGGTVGAFLKEHPKGLYLVGTCDHLFAVLNGGQVVHHGQNPTGLRCKVQDAWRVLKSR